MREAGVEVDGGDGQGDGHVQVQAAIRHGQLHYGNLRCLAAEGHTRHWASSAQAMRWATEADSTRKSSPRGWSRRWQGRRWLVWRQV